MNKDRTWWFLLIPAGTPDLRKRSDRRKTLLAGLVNVRSRAVGAVTSSSLTKTIDKHNQSKNRSQLEMNGIVNMLGN